MSRRRRFQDISSIEEASMNLTPLIDVVFVVLVIFIIIAPMVNIDRIELAEGVATTKQSQNSKALNIHIRKDNTFWLNQRKVSQQELQSLLKQAKQQYPESVPQIMPDKNASFQAYEHVRTAAKDAGFAVIDVNLSP